MIEYDFDKINEVKKLLLKKQTNLEVIRHSQKMSRKELSEKSGINIRTIESYEQQKRNINNAKMDTLIKLSKSLNCKIEDIIEKKA